MTESFLALIPAYGVWLLVVTAFLSCLALPLPTSAVLASSGAFVASGDLILWQVIAGGFSATLVGDQFMFRLGRAGGARLAPGGRQEGKTFRRAESLIEKFGGSGVFLSRTIFSPVGPCVSFVAGAAKMNWTRFTGAAAPGAAIWVSAYVGLGYGVAGQLEAAMDLIASSGALIATVFVAIAIGFLLVRRLSKIRQEHAESFKAAP